MRCVSSDVGARFSLNGGLPLVPGYYGLHWAEVSGLRVEDVDLERSRLHVEVTVARVRGYHRKEAPKEDDHRSTSIPAFLLRHDEKQIAGRSGEATVSYGQRTGI